VNGAEFGPGWSNWRWKATVAWLWLSSPRFMFRLRRRRGRPVVVPPHTFGGE